MTAETIQNLSRFVIARSQRVGAERRPMTGSATKQSILTLLGTMDCFASLAMTVLDHNTRVAPGIFRSAAVSAQLSAMVSARPIAALMMAGRS